VEDHPVHRHLGLQHLQQVPGDRLALAVLIGGEEEFVRVLQRPFELADLFLLVGIDDVVGLETVVDVDRELAERSLLHVRRQLAGLGQVTDVTDAGLHVELRPEVLGDRAGLAGRLDDHEPPAAAGLAGGHGLTLSLRSLDAGRRHTTC
jgi:hypothetical protein